MKRITICSSAYVQALIDFYYNEEKEHIVREGKTGDAFFFTVPEKTFNAPLMMEMMEGVILENNPVIRGQARLFERVRRVVFEPGRRRQTEALRRYVHQAHYLNVEGYIHFRLPQYEHLISHVLYTVVKRNLCIEQ